MKQQSQQGKQYQEKSLVQSIAQSIMRGGESLETVPMGIRRIINEKSWRYIAKDDNEYWQDSEFERFISEPYPNGLGASVALIRALCQDHPDALQAFNYQLAESVQPAINHGGDRTIASDLSHLRELGGDSEERIIRTLKRDEPELARLVIDGEITAQEGKRRWKVAQGKRPTWNIYCNPMNLESFADNLRSKLTPEEIAELIELLTPPNN